MENPDPAAGTRPRVVAGFDGSASGLDAVALGRTLAEAIGGVLIVTHVYPYVTGTAPSLALDPEVADELRRAARETLELAAPALRGFADWETCAVPCGRPARGLLEAAGELRGDLVVLGSTHRHGLGRVMPGTTAVKLLFGSYLPVVVAPAGWRDAPRRVTTIGAGFDGSPESLAALHAAVALGHAARASVEAIAVFEAPNPANPIFAVTSHGYGEITRDLRDALADRLDAAATKVAGDGPRPRTELRTGDPVEVLVRESGRLDLLAIGSRGYGSLRTVLLGTHGSELLRRSACPVLVAPRGIERPLDLVRPPAANAGAGA
jgi:nucleotide-binding universal stress UspA family protein